MIYLDHFYRKIFAKTYMKTSFKLCHVTSFSVFDSSEKGDTIISIATAFTTILEWFFLSFHLKLQRHSRTCVYMTSKYVLFREKSHISYTFPWYGGHIRYRKCYYFIGILKVITRDQGVIFQRTTELWVAALGTEYKSNSFRLIFLFPHNLDRLLLIN